MTGYPNPLAASTASCSDVTVVPGGCLMSSFCRTVYHWSRSSAASIDDGCVPQMRTGPSPEAAWIGLASKYLASGVASLSGVWPPNWTMMPSGRSFSMTLSTSSTVNGSKYSRDDVS